MSIVDEDYKRIRGEDKKPRKKRGPPSEETKKKISDALKGYKWKDEWKEHLSSRVLGMPKSEEHKLKISETMKKNSVTKNNNRNT